MFPRRGILLGMAPNPFREGAVFSIYVAPIRELLVMFLGSLASLREKLSLYLYFNIRAYCAFAANFLRVLRRA